MSRMFEVVDEGVLILPDYGKQYTKLNMVSHRKNILAKVKQRDLLWAAQK